MKTTRTKMIWNLLRVRFRFGLRSVRPRHPKQLLAAPHRPPRRESTGKGSHECTRVTVSHLFPASITFLAWCTWICCRWSNSCLFRVDFGMNEPALQGVLNEDTDDDEEREPLFQGLSFVLTSANRTRPNEFSEGKRMYSILQCCNVQPAIFCRGAPAHPVQQEARSSDDWRVRWPGGRRFHGVALFFSDETPKLTCLSCCCRCWTTRLHASWSPTSSTAHTSTCLRWPGPCPACPTCGSTTASRRYFTSLQYPF